MLWEQLVTDGHVRAARLRRVQPWVIVLGLILLWAGIVISALGPRIQPQSSVASRIQEQLAEHQLHAAAAFGQLAEMPQRVDKPESLPPVSEIPEVIKATLESLGAKDKLPSDAPPFEEIKRAEFWSAQWGTEHVYYMKSGHTYLVGAYAHVG